MSERGTFTGYQRKRRTGLAVRVADHVSHHLITVGGIGTIVAVCTVCVFLVYVALPLFASPDVSSARQQDLPATDRPVRYFAVDEYKVLAWTLSDDGRLQLFRLDTGALVDTHNLAGDKKLTSTSLSIDSRDIALGFSDGIVQLGQIRFVAGLLADDEVPEQFRDMAIGEVATVDKSVLARSAGGFRRHAVSVELEDPIEVAPGQAIIQIDRAQRSGGPVFCALTEDLHLFIEAVRKRENLLTGEVTYALSGGDVVLRPPSEKGRPVQMLMSGTGDNVYLAWDDGHLLRYDARNLEAIALVEQVDLVPKEDISLTRLDMLLGKATLLAGDSEGGVTAWFRIRTQDANAPADRWTLVQAHALQGPNAPVTSFSSSQRTRVVAVGYANGDIRLFQVTTDQSLAKLHVGTDEAVHAVALAPKEDGLCALGSQGLWQWDIDLKHPEATLSALFSPVWYEGATEPQHVWQSSSGDDAFEPKLGLMPLVFGTVKATLYSLLFGVPLALLAALYSSEFLHPRLRTRIKAVIELMATLPSVVLGFLAALVIAPYVENKVPAILTGIAMVPAVLIFSGYLWQFIPRRIGLRLERWRLLLSSIAILPGILAAFEAGPVVEGWLFAGDFRAWLDGQHGSGSAGWAILLLPLTAVGTAVMISLYVTPWLRRRTRSCSQTQAALADLGKFVAGVVATLLVAASLSVLLNKFGWDPRGGSSLLGTYVQRNALVVGFIMGFAIIPIIYTIAEDALSTVPEHLRAASLGTGATPWQTATRIVIPTAMSGLFSAMMIGLGRAVGETMIVLMAGGNTPIMEWNIFNGIRTLSANIAVELPEAPQNSTHYRTLFLAALVLFAITFVVNTVAEIVRLRFRRRAYQL